jgi:Transglutaminase-like superfamily
MAEGRLALAAEVLALYPRARWLLARRELPEAVAALRGARSRPAADPDPVRCAVAVERVLRLLPADSRCLVRSLVLLALLERRGLGAALVIGVLPEPEFAAHAWVEHRGRALLAPGPAGAGRLVEL